MNYSVTYPQPQLHPKQTSFPSLASKPPNQTLQRAKFIPIVHSTQCGYAADQIQSLSSHKDPTTKEVLISDFVKRRADIIHKITQISQQTEDEEKRIAELRRLIFIKPLIQEAADIQYLLKDTDFNSGRQSLQDLTNDIELSLSCLQNLLNFCQTQKSLPQTERMKQTAEMIEFTWQQIYRLPIYDPLLISEVSRVEWIFRAFEVLNHDRADSKFPFVEYCELLRKGALTSQNKEIHANKLSRRIEEELQKYRRLVKKVKLLFKQEGNQGSAQKMDAQQVQELLRELEHFRFGLKQEIESVEGVLQRALELGERFNEFLKKKILVSSNDLLEFMLELRNSPVRFKRIEEYIAQIFNDQEKQVQVVHQELARRITEENRELSLGCYRFAGEIARSGGTTLPEAKEVWRACGQEIHKIKRYSEELIQGLQILNFRDFCILSQGITERGYEHIKAELWLAKVRFLQMFCDSLIKPSNPITLEEVRSFLPEIEDYVSSLPSPKRAPFDEQIGFLHCLLYEIEVWIDEERNKLMESGKRISDKILYGFIDVTKEMTKPAEKQQKQLLNPELHSKGIQFQKISHSTFRVKFLQA